MIITVLQLIVCLIDFVYPLKVGAGAKKKEKHISGFMHEKSSGSEDLAENVKDDLVDEEGSDSEEVESDKDKDSKAASNSPNVRKRKARKAD